MTFLGCHGGAGEADGVALRSFDPPTATARGGFRAGARLRRARAALGHAVALGADVYHLHDPELLSIVPALARRTGAPVIYDAHEDSIRHMLQKREIPAPLRAVAAAGVLLAELRAWRSLAAVVTADEGVAGHFRRLGLDTVVLHNFVRLDLFDGAEPPPQRSWDLAYHGSVPRYHLETVLAVDDALVARGREARWLFVTRLFDGEQRWLDDQLARRGATERFTIHPRVPHTEIAALVQRARVGFIPLPDLPKFRRNIPTKLFEFMALGMPVVLSDLPPTRRFVDDGRAAWAVPPGDADAYADAIDALLGDAARREAMGREGRRRAHESLHWGAEVPRMLALYRRVTGARLEAGG